MAKSPSVISIPIVSTNQEPPKKLQPPAQLSRSPSQSGSSSLHTSQEKMTQKPSTIPKPKPPTKIAPLASPGATRPSMLIKPRQTESTQASPVSKRSPDAAQLQSLSNSPMVKRQQTESTPVSPILKRQSDQTQAVSPQVIRQAGRPEGLNVPQVNPIVKREAPMNPPPRPEVIQSPTQMNPPANLVPKTRQPEPAVKK